MIRLEKVDSIRNWKSEWMDFAKKNQENLTIASNPSLRAFFTEYFGYKDHYHFVVDHDEVIGLFPAVCIGGSIVALPHFSYDGVLVGRDNENVKRLMLGETQVASKNYELRSFDPMGAFHSDNKVVSWLYLEDTQQKQMAGFKSKLRSQIKKGYKNGLTAVFGGADFLNDFYEVYARNMRDLGSPVLGKSFFSSLIDHLDEGDVEIHLVKNGDRVVGAGFVLSYLNCSEVCWASTLRQFNRLNTNMVLYWSMIERSIELNREVFSFGRSSKNSSTLRFKKQWGAIEKQLYFNSNQEKKIDIKKAQLLSQIWKRLPYKLTVLLGPPIAKRIY